MSPLNLATVICVLGVYGIIIWNATFDNSRDDTVAPYLNTAVAFFTLMLIVQLARTPKRFDLETQFIFYASHHQHPGNKVIHMIFVWPILWTGLLFMSFSAPVFSVSCEWRGGGVCTTQEYGGGAREAGRFDLHWASMVYAVFYMAYYVKLHKCVGTCAALLVAFCWVTAEMASQARAGPDVLRWGLYAHAACWVAQFLGHALMEGRAPALLDNLAQSFIMAPLFVIIESFQCIGFEKKMFERIAVRVEENIRTFKEGGEVHLIQDEKTVPFVGIARL